jgi:hypothetical protein
MIAPESNPALCAICDKAAGNFTCRGCTQHFCTNHVIEHRQALGKTMDEIMLEHDQLRESLTERGETLTPHVFMKQIDEWEEESIKVIHQAATESRNQLRNVVDRFKNKILQILDPIGLELTKFREDDNFVETQLTEWTAKLEKLKKELTMLSPVNMERDSNDTSFINRLSVIEVPDDIFQESVGNIVIGDNGKVITHGFWSSHGAVRGKDEYSSGCYRFNFKLEDFDKATLYGFFFGIISKLSPLQKGNLHTNTSCGWLAPIGEYDSHQFRLNVINSRKSKNERNYRDIGWHIEKNDIFELLINCDRQQIRLTNKRTNKVDETTVDIDQCRFPWQLTFSLYDSKQRIRLLTP